MSENKNQVATSRKLAVINSISSVATHVISLTILVWLQKYLLDNVSIAEYSLFPVVAAPMVFIPLITTILTAGLGRYSVDAYAKGDMARVTSILSTMTPLLFGAALLVMLMGAIGVWQIDNILKIEDQFVDDARWMMVIFVAGASLRIAFAAYGVGLFIKQKFVFVNIIDLGGQVLRIALLALFLLAIDTRVVWVVLATTLANSAALAVRLIVSKRLIPGLKFDRSKIDWSIAPEIASFGSWNFLNQASTALRLFASIFFLNRFANPIHVTSFHLGTLVLRQIQALSNAALKPLSPPLVAMWAHGEIDRIKAVYLNGGRYALWLATLGTCPVIIFGPAAVALYLGKTEANVALTTQVMTIVVLILPLRFGNIMMGRLANTAGRAKEVCGISLAIHVPIMIVTAILVIGFDLGALGAAIAILGVNILVVPTIALPFAFKLADVSPGRWFKETVVPGLVPGIAASVVWLGLSLYFKPNSWTELLLCGMGGFVILAATIFFYAMKPRERQDFYKIAGAIKKKVGLGA
ncbi:MAG: O-antigen/teichoic acid export membrane protein [Planctomycetota bacterium]|jgi:O-antigen/teichoic acid export membrane protein